MCHLIETLFISLFFFFQVATQLSFCPSNPGRNRKSTVDEFENISSFLKCYRESVLVMKSKCFFAMWNSWEWYIFFIFNLSIRTGFKSSSRKAPKRKNGGKLKLGDLIYLFIYFWRITYSKWNVLFSKYLRHCSVNFTNKTVLLYNFKTKENWDEM